MKTWTPRQIRAARRARRWTQRALAAALGVTVKTVHRYEHGRRHPCPSVLVALDAMWDSDAPAPDEARPSGGRGVLDNSGSARWVSRC